MSENTNTFITGEVYPYQITDRTLSFIPKLSPAADDHFKELVTGKIKISQMVKETMEYIPILILI